MSMLHRNSFSINSIVIGMGADELHIHGLVAICHRDHQTIVIAFDVEDNSAVL
jgi:hypothetical protein